MLNQSELSKLKAGDKLSHFLIITKVEERITRTNKPYLNLELRDKSLQLSAKLWENIENNKLFLQEGKIVKVTGLIEDYQGTLQIKIGSVTPLNETDNVQPSDFLPKSGRDFQTMERELTNRISSINNEHLKKLLKNILSGENYKSYVNVPAGKAWHHSYIHGLLEHTLEIIKICDVMCDIHPELNRDLLVSGAVLHDFGKTQELTYEPSFDYTDKGKLLGHIVLSAIEIEKAAKKISNFPDDLKDQLIHLVLSHQGKLEYASPVEPKTIEAIALYHADELSAKINAYKLAVKAEISSDSNWTKYLPLAGTSLFIPKEDLNKDKTLFDQ
ncbi:MAG: HD domain-containing protein [Ignavibacteria bacterium]|jgi:3'-5' exoribonuclease